MAIGTAIGPRGPTSSDSSPPAASVLYGTDLGNGDLPVGVNVRELEALTAAGVRGSALIEALTDPWPFAERSHGVATFVPGEPPGDVDAIPAWLAGATVLPTEELIPDVHG